MNRVTQALSEIRQSQQTVAINVETFLRSGGRDAAARLDSAIEDERRTLERCVGERREYLAKVIR
jgi:hypothetical protein